MTLVTWLAMLGLDFLFNAGLFAPIYQTGSSFMLSPAQALRRIPLGYLAFLIVAFGIVELAYRLRIYRIAQAIKLGLVSGGVVGSVWALSLYSVSTLAVSAAIAFAVMWLGLLLLGWPVAVAGLARASLAGLAIRVAAFDGICLVTVITLQSLGLVPITAL